MNREQAKALLPIIAAFANGEEVQCKVQGGQGTWHTAEHFSFDGSPDCYRIKPEPRSRFILERIEDGYSWGTYRTREQAERVQRDIDLDSGNNKYRVVEYVEKID